MINLQTKTDHFPLVNRRKLSDRQMLTTATTDTNFNTNFN